MKNVSILILLNLILFAKGTKIPTDVLDLNDKFVDVANEGSWFIKFYAPWCGHCKKLAPVWDQLAHSLTEKNSLVRIGKVDCTRFASACTHFKVTGYPTLIFFRNGVQIPYEGDRQKQALLNFVLKASSPTIGTLDSTAKFSELKKSSEKDPFFVYIDGEDKDQTLFEEYKNVAESLFAETRFFHATSIMPFPANVVLRKRPAVVVFKDNDYYVYEPEKEKLHGWVNSERWPLLPQVTPSTLNSIATSTNKLLVLVVLDSIYIHNSSSEVGRFYKLAKDASKLVRQDSDLHSQFQFGWLDGNSIVNSIVMGEMSVPNILVFNVSNYEFYLNNDVPSEMTAQSVYTFLQTIADKRVTPLGGRSWPQRIRRMFYDITTNLYEMFYHQPILTCCLFGVPLAFFSIITYSICSSDFSVDREDVYPEDEEEESQDEEDDSIHKNGKKKCFASIHILDDGHEKDE
uniref:Thioredoxin domain-containing protein n=1 Tax=Acrobeloides nanus TaxID=290746 RepID=A0A914C997_9BILA